MKSFEEFITEAALPKWMAKKETKTISFEIEDGDEFGAATGIAGKVNSGKEKGKYTTYITSGDLDMRLKTNNYYDTLEAALESLPKAKDVVKLSDLRKTHSFEQ